MQDGRFWAFSADGLQILSGGDKGAAQLWSTGDSSLVRSFSGGDAYFHGGAFSPDGRYVATSGREHLVRIWNAQTGQLLHELAGHALYAYSTYDVTFHPDSSILASADGDKTVRLWEVETGRPVSLLEGEDEMVSVSFSPDGRMVAAGCADRKVYLWSSETGELLKRFEGIHTDMVWAMAFSPDGKRIVSGDQSGKMVIWNVLSGTHLLQQDSQQTGIWGLAWSPDGATIVSAGENGTLRCWDGEPVHSVDTDDLRLLKQRVAQWEPAETLDSLRLAFSLVWTGQTNEHTAFCRLLLDYAERVETDKAVTAERAAKAYLVLPASDPELLRRAVKLADQAWIPSRGWATHGWFELCLGLARYRDGDFPGTIEALSQSISDSHHNIKGPSLLLRSMALQQMGRTEEARQSLRAGETLLEPEPPNGKFDSIISLLSEEMFFWLIHAEAKTLIEEARP